MINYVPTEAQGIVTYSESQMKGPRGPDYSKPFIASSITWLAAKLENEEGDPQWKDEINNFKKSFCDSPPASGRGQKKLSTTEMGDEVIQWWRQLCPPATEYSDASTRAMCSPSIFGMAQNCQSHGFEVGCLPTMRLGLLGARRVGVSRFTDIGAYVRNIKGGKALSMPISSSHVTEWLKKATTQDITNFYKENVNMWWGTVGPNDLLYIPAGFIKFESTLDKAPVYGLRWAGPIKGDEHASTQLRAAINEKMYLGSVSNALQACLQFHDELEKAPDDKTPANEVDVKAITDSYAEGIDAENAAQLAKQLEEALCKSQSGASEADEDDDIKMAQHVGDGDAEAEGSKDPIIWHYHHHHYSSY